MDIDMDGDEDAHVDEDARSNDMDRTGPISAPQLEQHEPDAERLEDLFDDDTVSSMPSIPPLDMEAHEAKNSVSFHSETQHLQLRADEAKRSTDEFAGKLDTDTDTEVVGMLSNDVASEQINHGSFRQNSQHDLNADASPNPNPMPPLESPPTATARQPDSATCAMMPQLQGDLAALHAHTHTSDRSCIVTPLPLPPDDPDDPDPDLDDPEPDLMELILFISTMRRSSVLLEAWAWTACWRYSQKS